MIQSLLLFCFGFLAAVLIALVVAPAFWRRAARLTERRVRATLPLTMNEIQAERDGLRAEFAMSTRRLGMKVENLRDRVATQMIEIERAREELERSAGECESLKAEGAALETKNSELETALKASGEEREALLAKFEALGAQMADKDTEISRLDFAATDASLEVSNRQIELAAREAEVARLEDDLERLKEGRRQSDRKLREIVLDNKSGRAALKTERARAGDLERRLEKALSTLADREEALARRERESAGPGEGQSKTARPDKTPPAHAEAADPAPRQEALERLATERKRLEERLTTLTRENKRLRTVSLTPPPASLREAGTGAGAGGGSGAGSGEVALRERIGELAAEMVALTALIEGPGSPIDKALALPETEHAGAGQPSLAERVRALREAAARRQ